MSHLFAGQVLARYSGSAIARDVLAFMALHLDHRRRDRPVTVSIERLALLCKRSATDVRYGIRELRRDGCISPAGSDKGGRGHPTPYTVNIAIVMAMADRSKARSGQVAPIAATDRGRARRQALQETLPPAQGLSPANPSTEHAKPFHGGPINPSTGDDEQGFNYNKVLTREAEPPKPQPPREGETPNPFCKKSNVKTPDLSQRPANMTDLTQQQMDENRRQIAKLAERLVRSKALAAAPTPRDNGTPHPEIPPPEIRDPARIARMEAERQRQLRAAGLTVPTASE